MCMRCALLFVTQVFQHKAWLDKSVIDIMV